MNACVILLFYLNTILCVDMSEISRNALKITGLHFEQNYKCGVQVQKSCIDCGRNDMFTKLACVYMKIDIVSPREDIF